MTLSSRFYGNMFLLHTSPRKLTRTFLTIVAGLILFVGLVPTVSAQNLVGRQTRADLSIKAGLISGMDMTGSRDLESGIGLSFQLGASLPLGSKLYVPFSFDFHNISISRENSLMIEPSLGLKGRFYFPKSEITLRPGGAIGFGYLSDQGDLRASQYLTYKLFAEALFKMDDRRFWVAEVAFFDAPIGSSKGDEVKLGPGLLVRFGVAFK